MPQICDMGPTALLPLRRKARWGFFRPEKSWWLRPGLNLRTWVLKGSMLPLDHQSCCTSQSVEIYIYYFSYRSHPTCAYLANKATYPGPWVVHGNCRRWYLWFRNNDSRLNQAVIHIMNDLTQWVKWLRYMGTGFTKGFVLSNSCLSIWVGARTSMAKLNFRSEHS